MKAVFTYGQEEINYLKKKDKKLARIIDDIGLIEREVNSDLFSSLIYSIIGQQISNKAAETVCNRFDTLLKDVTPLNLAMAKVEDIQQCGMTMKKAQYIKGIGEAITDGRLNLESLDSMKDEDVIKSLSSLNGVGVWTAEMLLIFSMCRKDVLSFGDLAIRRGMCNLYGHKTLTKELFNKYKKRYSPYGSIASLYLWELSHIENEVKKDVK